jgi:Cu-processing system permease protein
VNVLLIIAGKEIRDGVRNRWVVAATVLLAALALTLALLGSTPSGAVKVSPLVVTVVSLSSLTIFIIPLIALLLSYDAIVGEIDRGTMALLLAYPVSRMEVVIGKFLGHVAILAIATTIGYGAAGLSLLAVSGRFDPESWHAFAAMIGSSIMLGAVFIAIGYLVSAWVRERSTAGGIAIGVWLFFVIIYDMALLGILVADQGRILTAGRLNWVLLFNPADAYRLINLAGFSNVAMFSGMAGASAQAQLGLPVLVAALVGWTVLPLGIATALFSRRQL